MLKYGPHRTYLWSALRYKKSSQIVEIVSYLRIQKILTNVISNPVICHNYCMNDMNQPIYLWIVYINS
jgi:hypothetical protein